jgi:apolipoprotein N-acyltransferase
LNRSTLTFTGSRIMKRSPVEKLLLALLSGLMLTASFPPGPFYFLAWFALVPLLKSLENETPSDSLRLGFAAGLAHYLTLIYWVVIAMGHYGHLPLLVSVSILILFALYLSVYPALFAWGCALIGRSFLRSFKVAGLWVALEYVRANILTGFPWCLLGHTQYLNLEAIQIADLVGAYGTSFVIVLSSTLIYGLVLERNLKLWKLEAPLILLTLALVLGYGYYRTSDRQASPGTLRVAIAQGNIDQSIKWNPAYQEKTIQIYRTLTLQSRAFRPDLVVWPETAVPLFFQDGEPLARSVLLVSREVETYMIFGSPAYRRERGSLSLFNRAYLTSPSGEVLGFYDKVHLVPFGEYVPLKRFLPFVQQLVPSAGDFLPGDKVAPLKFPKAAAGVLICFESIFPELGRALTEKGATLLVNLTNDAWYGMSSAPFQHFSMAVFRAVENRRPLVRAANTGITAFILPSGEIVEQSDLFTEALLTREIPLSDSGLTLYTRYGDFFAIALTILSAVNIFFAYWYTKKQSRRTR